LNVDGFALYAHLARILTTSCSTNLRARKAWRVHGMMQCLMDEIPFSDDRSQLLRVLGAARDELDQAYKLISGEIHDDIGFFDERKKQWTSFENAKQ
jgi:hypothetical protein